jgi:hypothetical protein
MRKLVTINWQPSVIEVDTDDEDFFDPDEVKESGDDLNDYVSDAIRQHYRDDGLNFVDDETELAIASVVVDDVS